MFIHMFAFRWKDDVTEEQKERALEEARSLVAKVPGLLEAWAGKNISPRGQGYQHGGVMQSADRASLEAYGGHPEHQKLVAWLMPLTDPIEVDFEVS